MPIHSYGVLKCKAIDRRLGTNDNPHYQVHVTANNEHFRIAINEVTVKPVRAVILYD